MVSFSRLSSESQNINLSSYHCKVLILFIFTAYTFYTSLHTAENRIIFSSSKYLNASRSTYITQSNNIKRRNCLNITKARIQTVNWGACIILCAMPQSVPLPKNTITETTLITPSFKYGQKNQKENKNEYNSPIMKKAD